MARGDYLDFENWLRDVRKVEDVTVADYELHLDKISDYAEGIIPRRWQNKSNKPLNNFVRHFDKPISQMSPQEFLDNYGIFEKIAEEWWEVYSGERESRGKKAAERDPQLMVKLYKEFCEWKQGRET